MCRVMFPGTVSEVYRQLCQHFLQVGLGGGHALQQVLVPPQPSEQL